MNKDEFLQELSNKINTGEITKQEVMGRFSEDSKHFSVTKMLYVLGAAVVVVGIVIFVGQVWEDIGALGHIVVTLGLGLVLTVMGAVLLKQSAEQQTLGSVFYAMGGLLIPGGALVTLSELSTGQDPTWPITITFGIISLFYILLTLTQRHVVLTLFAVFNSTAFIYLLVQAMIGGSFYMHGDLYAYLTVVMGIAYLLLAYSFEGGWNKKLVGALCFLGSVGFLGAAFSPF